MAFGQIAITCDHAHMKQLQNYLNTCTLLTCEIADTNVNQKAMITHRVIMGHINDLMMAQGDQVPP